MSTLTVENDFIEGIQKVVQFNATNLKLKYRNSETFQWNIMQSLQLLVFPWEYYVEYFKITSFSEKDRNENVGIYIFPNIRYVNPQDFFSNLSMFFCENERKWSEQDSKLFSILCSGTNEKKYFRKDLMGISLKPVIVVCPLLCDNYSRSATELYLSQLRNTYNDSS